MKIITIGVDGQLERLLREKAESHGSTLDKTIKRLLRSALGISTMEKEEKKKQFLDIFGVWDKQQEKEFNMSTKAFEKIDKEDWA